MQSKGAEHIWAMCITHRAIEWCCPLCCHCSFVWERVGPEGL